MTGHRPFTELTKGFTPARRARVAAKAAALREEMMLEELRKARDLSQGRDCASAGGRPARRCKAGEAHLTCTSATCAAMSRPWAGSWRLRLVSRMRAS